MPTHILKPTVVIERVKAKLTMQGKQLRVSIRNQNGDNAMLNLCREIQGCINSFKLIIIWEIYTYLIGTSTILTAIQSHVKNNLLVFL